MNIIFFDGYCAMCHWAVKWVAKRDKNNSFYFAPLQGSTAAEKLQGIELPDSLVYFEDGNIYFFSKACFRIAWTLGGPWALIGWLSFLPDWMLYPTNLIYRLIAKTRSTSCDITISGVRFLP
jgi:predicted DCC family thiol-disulfide oxidoreductase YuxK